MIPARADVRAALRAALTGHGPEAPAVRFGAPLVTAIVADVAAGPLASFAPLLEETIEGLVSAGIPRGRQFVLCVTNDGSAPAIERAAWRAALGVPVLAHDPAGPTFRVRAEPAPPLELDDELREAEAIVTVGRMEARAGHVSGGPLLLCPGAAGAATVAEWRRLRDTAGLAQAIVYSLAVERALPVDLALTWDRAGRVAAAPGATAFAALARVAGGP